MVALVESPQGENYRLRRQYVNPVLARVLQMIGYDIMYNKGEVCHLFDVDEQRYLDFLGGRDASDLGRNHPHVRRVIHETLEWCTPNMVQMDCPVLSGLLAEALVERVGKPPAGPSLQRPIWRRAESEGKRGLPRALRPRRRGESTSGR